MIDRVMHARRLVKRSLIGSRVYAPGSGAAVAGEAGERETRDTPVASGHTEEEAVKGSRKPSLKVCSGRGSTFKSMCMSVCLFVCCRGELVFVFVFVLIRTASYVGHRHHHIITGSAERKQ